MMFYIYIIQNKLNEKLYVGKTNNLTRRWREHKKVANGGKEKYGKDFRAIHAALKKYGINNFNIFDMEVWENETDAYEAEKFWIDFFQSHRKDIGYNETMGGDGFLSGKNHPMYGTHPSEETRQKLKEARKGRKPSLGVKLSETIRAAMSVRNAGKNNPMYGRHHSDNGKLNISQAKKGKPSSLKGTKKSIEQIEVMRQAALLAFSKLAGEDCINAKLTNEEAGEIRDLFKHKIFSPKEIWKMYGISKPTLYRIVKGTTYKI